MSNTEAPDPWAAAMIEKGCTHNGRPSISALARKMGTSVETARRLVNGVGDPSPATIKEAVRVLGVQVHDWTSTAPVGEPYQAPASSAWLTERQRQALDELINAFVERGGGVNGQASTTETSRAEGSSANESAVVVDSPGSRVNRAEADLADSDRHALFNEELSEKERGLVNVLKEQFGEAEVDRAVRDYQGKQ